MFQKGSKKKRKPVWNNDFSASITIYILLVLILLIVLICTVAESARVNAINSKLRGITYMGMDSVFSEYAAPVFEDYGVMMLWCKDEEFVKRFDEFVRYNLESTGISLIPAADLYDISHAETVLTDVKKADHENGKLFEDQVYEYMKYYIAESAAEQLLKDSDLFEQGNRLKEFMDKINRHKDVFIAVEKSVGRIKEKVNKVQSAAADPYKNLSGISDSLEKFERTDDDAFLNGVYVEENDLINSRYMIADSLDDISRETERYHDNAEKAKKAIDELESELYVEKDSYSEEVYKSIEAEIADIRQKSGESEADFYKLEQNLEIIDVYKGKVESLDGLFEAMDQDITKENVTELKSIVNDYKAGFEDFDLSGLTVNYDTERTEKESSDFLNVISTIFDKGVLGYVAPDCSDKKADISNVPSKNIDRSVNNLDGNIITAGLNKALFSEYIRKHFGRYTQIKEETALKYETEYILGGKASDKENLKKVMDDLILMRTGLNLISIMTDGEKKTEAYMLAAAIVGFTGMPVFIKIMQMVILSAWSLAEAIVDARILFEGDKVPVIKQSHEWNLSLEAVKNFSSSSIKGEGRKNGSSYEDYLRSMLILQDRQVQVMRTMDVIQMNMAANENEDFRISDCIMEASVEAAYEAPSRFTALPLVIRFTGFISGYSFKMAQTYAY